MYLQDLTLHNFKCFENLELDFHPNLTVIVGADGSGKTSVLEAVAIAISTLFVKMDGLSGRGIDKSQAHLKPLLIGSTKSIQPQYPVIVKASAMIGSEKAVWFRSLNKPTGSVTFIDAKEIIDIGICFQERLRRGDTSLMLPVVAYYGTRRLWNYHQWKQSNVLKTSNRNSGYIGCVDGAVHIKLMMDWFFKMTVRKYQNQELGAGDIPELEAVYSAMESCYQRITGSDFVRIRYNIVTRELEIVHKDPSVGLVKVSINQLSDEYKSTISLVADIAYRMAVLNPQLLGDVCKETDGIILIDEVDLHLHPAWQQRILKDLTEIFPKVQFIVSTHAPAVISTVKSENIVMLDKEVNSDKS